MGIRLLFGMIGLATALLAAWGLEQLFRLARTPDALQGTRVLLFRTDPEIVRRLRERGAQFGDPQLSLMWNNINDLDLHCVEPTGTHIWFRNRRSEQTGGQLDVDANADPTTRTDRPVENIYWSPGNAPQGTYEVYVHHFANHGAPDPTPYTLRIVANGRVREYRGSLRPGEESQRVRFDPAQVQGWEVLHDGSQGWLALPVMAGWGAALGLALALTLRLPQRWFGVDARHFSMGQVLVGLMGSTMLGAVSGLLGQIIFYPLAALSEPFARYIGLLTLGGVLGYGLHHFVPNLPL
ncbi:MAG: YfaP family protein, partial [Fimbriimonadales bacterium]|nr:YfaP family protein [Fimbriimonadales bacterium]